MSAGPAAQRRHALLVGLVVAVVFAVVALFSLQASNGIPGTARHTATATFADIGPQLLSGGQVLVDGDDVGKITAIDHVADGARVTMQLRGNIKLWKNATAAVDDESVLGQGIVDIDPGTSSAGGPISAIPLASTQPGTDLENVLNVFTPSARRSTQGFLGQLGNGLAGQGPSLNSFLAAAPSTLGDVGSVSGALASPQADLAATLRNADTLVGRFQGHNQQLASLLTQLNTTFDAINVGNDAPLSQTLRDLPPTLTAADGALLALNSPLQQTQQAVTALAPGAAALGQATPSLQSVLRGAVTPLRELPGVEQAANPAVSDLTTTVIAAQPLVPRFDEGLNAAITPIQVLASYTPDIEDFDRLFSLWSSDHSGFQHEIRLDFNVNPATLNGVGSQQVDPYPAVGQAFEDGKP